MIFQKAKRGEEIRTVHMKEFKREVFRKPI